MSDILCNQIIDEAGSEIDARVIGPFRDRRKFVVCAYHIGNGGGVNRATLSLEMDGMLLGAAEDNNFANYNLTIRRVVLLEAGTTASFVITWTNHNATTTAHGIHALATQVSMNDASLRS